MSVDPYRAPATTLDAQIELVDRLHRQNLTGYFQALETIEGRRFTGWVSTHDTSREGTGAVKTLTDALMDSITGWTLWVSADAAAAVDEASMSIPAPEHLQVAAGTIPAQDGMLWIAGDPQMILDDRPVRAISWTARMWPGASTDEAGEPRTLVVPSVVVWPWAELDGPWGPIGAMGPIVLPLSRNAASMIDDYDPEWAVGEWQQQDWEGLTRTDSRVAEWVMAAWVMCGQVLPRHIETASRAQRRRARRLPMLDGPEWGDVHVTTLRRADRGGTDWQDETPEGLEPRFSHRWVVSGHWRWQPYGPGRADRRLTWIAPHIKGPEDAPLVEVEQIGKLVR